MGDDEETTEAKIQKTIIEGLESMRVRQIVSSHPKFIAAGHSSDFDLRASVVEKFPAGGILYSYRIDFKELDISVSLIMDQEARAWYIGFYNSKFFELINCRIMRTRSSSVLDFAIAQMFDIIQRWVDGEIEAITRVFDESTIEFSYHQMLEDNLRELWRFKLGV